MKNRVAVYLFYDANGIVDDYVVYFLSELRKVVAKVSVVINGIITKESRKLLDNFSDWLIVRENIGYDTIGYIKGTEQIGWNNLHNYDELVWTNSSIFGPFYPFVESFSTMEQLDIDWWGMQHAFEDKSVTSLGGIKIEGGYKPAYTLSNFLVFRRDFFLSFDFRNYWENVSSPNNYAEACFANEINFTNTMKNAGYDFAVYETEAMNGFAPSHTVNCSYYEVAIDRVPIVRRRVFTNPKVEYLNIGQGYDAYMLLEHLEKETDYPVEYIYSHLLRTQNMHTLHERLQQTYIVPRDYHTASDNSTSSVAIIFYIYYIDLVDVCLRHISNMPDEGDIYIYVVSEDVKNAVEENSKRYGLDNIKYKIMPNRGRDVSALLVTGREVLTGGRYDYVCFMHDKKVPHTKFRILGEQYFERCLSALLGTKYQVKNIIDLFDKNPFLGMLSPLPPYHSGYINVINGSWGKNFNKTSELMRELGIKVPININEPPVTAIGTMFWFRTKSFGKVIEKMWKYEDFPEEPIPAYDGTILHVLERLYALSVQDAGYYSAYVLNDLQARVDLTNKTYMLQHLVTNLQKRTTKNLVSFSDYKLFTDSPLPEPIPPEPINVIEKQTESIPLEPIIIIEKEERTKWFYQEVLNETPVIWLIKSFIKRIIPKPLWSLLRTAKLKRLNNKKG